MTAAALADTDDIFREDELRTLARLLDERHRTVPAPPCTTPATPTPDDPNRALIAQAMRLIADAMKEHQ